MYNDMRGTEIKLGAKVRIFDGEDYRKQCCPLDYVGKEFAVENLIYEKYVVINGWFIPCSCVLMQ